MTLQISTLRRRGDMPQKHFPASPFRLFEDFFNDWAMRAAERSSEGWRPAVDILEKDAQLIIKVEIPGVSEKEIELKTEGNTLTIRGEKRLENGPEGYTAHQIEGFYGTFSRSFTLAQTADLEKVSADYKNGILTITIPQRPETKPKPIKINF